MSIEKIAKDEAIERLRDYILDPRSEVAFDRLRDLELITRR